jgi:hypothetical protein
MCWKKIEIKENPVELIKVTLGSNVAAAEYAGVYIKNKHNNEYFKLGTEKFHTLCPITSADKKKEGWAFKKHIENYEYTSMSQANYAIYANPFKSGYGDSLLTISKHENITTQRQSEQLKENKRKTSKVADFFNKLKKITSIPLQKKQKELVQSTTHKNFTFSNELPAPKLKNTMKNRGLYKEEDKTVNIEWQKIESAEYRLEIFREEKGEYNSYVYDLQDNKFSFEPEGGNYFFRVKCFIEKSGQYTHGPYSENLRFTKLYPGNCAEENITIHLETYEDKHIYIKINGTWYGTGTKYGEPTSIINFPCPFKIEEIDFENSPKYIVSNISKDSSRNVYSTEVAKYSKLEINKKHTNKNINQSVIIACKARAF